MRQKSNDELWLGSMSIISGIRFEMIRNSMTGKSYRVIRGYCIVTYMLCILGCSYPQVEN